MEHASYSAPSPPRLPAQQMPLLPAMQTDIALTSTQDSAAGTNNIPQDHQSGAASQSSSCPFDLADGQEDDREHVDGKHRAVDKVCVVCHIRADCRCRRGSPGLEHYLVRTVVEAQARPLDPPSPQFSGLTVPVSPARVPYSLRSDSGFSTPSPAEEDNVYDCDKIPVRQQCVYGGLGDGVECELCCGAELVGIVCRCCWGGCTSRTHTGCVRIVLRTTGMRSAQHCLD